MVNFQEVIALFEAKSPEEMKSLAPKIIEVIGDTKIWCFEGDLGAGKTTLIQALCQTFNVIDQVTSPTYSLVQEYRDLEGNPYYHFDFYRLNHIQEALEMGCEEYFDSGHICFLEWPELVAPLLPDQKAKITIEAKENGTRIIKIAKHD